MNYNINIELLIGINIFMLSVIYFTQFVSYPLFLKVSKEKFTSYHDAYTVYISFIVAPAMVIELLLSLNILRYQIDLISAINLILISIIWLSTFLIQVPIHKTISFKKDSKKIKRLISTNYIRTISWCTKLYLSILLVS